MKLPAMTADAFYGLSHGPPGLHFMFWQWRQGQAFRRAVLINHQERVVVVIAAVQDGPYRLTWPLSFNLTAHPWGFD
jgi:hypothetical protein